MDYKNYYQEILDLFEKAGRLQKIGSEADFGFPDGWARELITTEGSFVAIADYDMRWVPKAVTDEDKTIDFGDKGAKKTYIEIDEFMKAKQGDFVAKKGHDSVVLVRSDGFKLK